MAVSVSTTQYRQILFTKEDQDDHFNLLSTHGYQMYNIRAYGNAMASWHGIISLKEWYRSLGLNDHQDVFIFNIPRM